jgi:hypothetical protein
MVWNDQISQPELANVFFYLAHRYCCNFLVTQISHEYTLDVAKCIELQMATFSLHSMTKCVELQEISFQPAKFSQPTRVSTVYQENSTCAHRNRCGGCSKMLEVGALSEKVWEPLLIITRGFTTTLFNWTNESGHKNGSKWKSLKIIRQQGEIINWLR